MKFIYPKTIKEFPYGINIFLLILGIGWITFNVYLLPFSVWTAGILRPWYMLHGYVPYKDFVWMRMPTDLFILSFWYHLVGVTPFAYQLFAYMLLIVLLLLVVFTSYIFFRSSWKYIYLFYIIVLFPFFQNTEEGELLVGTLSFIAFSLSMIFLNKEKKFTLFFIGIFSSLCFITKQNTGLLLVVVPAVLLVKTYLDKKPFASFIKKIPIYFLGVSIPILFLLSYFFVNNGLKDFFYYTVYVVLGPYRSSGVSQGDGFWIIAGYIVLIIPFLIFRKKSPVNLTQSLLICFFAFSLFPSLLPSFLSYRAYTIFPFIAIIAGVNIYTFLLNRKSKFIQVMLILAFILFGFFTFRFFESYISAIQYGEIKTGQLLTSYGDVDYEISRWIRGNSSEDEKIMVYGSEMIYLLSNRLPKNKYVDPFPYILKPYDESTKAFVDNPPRIIVYDQLLPNDHPGLSEWPLISILNKEYIAFKRYDPSIVIYIKK